MLTIKRANDTRVVKCIQHRVADIPGGVTVSVKNLVGGANLLEGTPLAKGTDGVFVVVKTAQIVTDADASATAYEVAKGSLFAVGDKFAVDGNVATITAIDTSDSAKDVITVDATLGVAVSAGACAYESDDSGKLANTPIAIAGSNYTVVADTNLFVDAWVIATVLEDNAPAVNDDIKTALKNIVYV